MQSSPARVVVLGSLNLDYIASVKCLPAPGQTIAATGLIRRFGGKGANQAIAAARHGVKVSMLGCVGEDDDGRAYLKRLAAESIDRRGMVTTGKALTGTALIAVDDAAENMIIVAAGANAYLTPRLVKRFQAIIVRADAVLMQFEIPIPTILAAVRIAHRAHVPVVLNPSPLRADFPWGESPIDALIVNAGEAQAIFGMSPRDLRNKRAAWRGALAKYSVAHLIITRGAQATICLTANDYLEVPALPVRPVDTVGAGDAFAGVLAASRAEGLDLVSAIRLANCAGGLTTLKPGAQEAIPTRAVTYKAARALR